MHVTRRRDVGTLRGGGVAVMEREGGEVAGGHDGPGRLPEPEAGKAAIDKARAGAPAVVPLTGQPDFAPANRRALFGRRILITAGPTQDRKSTRLNSSH